MSKARRYLTKSRFKVGYECPTKLCFLDDPQFGNNNVDNSFLNALAEGGFQVGELAKQYFPGGTEILTLDKEQAAAETAELLKRDSSIIYEGAIKFENLFIKADLLIKSGDSIEIIEVKAKSFDPGDKDQFYNKTSLKKGCPKLSSAWEPYLVDVAFQTYVLKKAYPHFNVTSSLMLADKSKKSTVDGLNQRFFLKNDEKGRRSVEVAPGTTKETLGVPILAKVSVDAEVRLVWDMTFENGMPFEKMVSYLSTLCAEPQFNNPSVGPQCKGCEFKIGSDLMKKGLKSGFQHCWEASVGLKSKDFERPFVFEIWNFRKTPKLIEDKRYFIDQLDWDDIAPTPKEDEAGLSSSERQWLQVEKVQKGDSTPYLDLSGISQEMGSWKFPLHFIDFETTMVAIPFNRGRRPYEQIAFQFSHHEVHQSGHMIHKDEYINRGKGNFPNFEFVRALKAALSKDQGTIFRYAAHENTVLCQIRQQLLDSEEPIKDRDDLISFIESITTSTGDSTKKWEGQRNMVDMCELVKKFYYSPATHGSNSIKKVLPAVLNESRFLQERYSKPIYGGAGQIVSKNYKDWVWIEKANTGMVLDPYKRLPPVFSDLDLETMDSLVTDGSIADGGAAMTAYARMQFTQMSESEVERVIKALLQYCELDTFAMVMIFEYWKSELERTQLPLKAA